MTIILGIDPGSRITGFGLIETSGSSVKYLESGCIRTEGGDMFSRLEVIFSNISELILQFKPSHAAIEEVFMHHNPQSAIKLGQARGVAIAAIKNAKLKLQGYSARQVKQAVVGYGAADKAQVQAMICRLLQLKSTPQVDAADALAIALCHMQTSASQARLKKQLESEA